MATTVVIAATKEKRVNFGLTDADLEHFYAKGFVKIERAIIKPVLETWRRDGECRAQLARNNTVWRGKIELPHTRIGYLHHIAPRAWEALLTLLGGVDRVLVPEIRDDWILNANYVKPEEWTPPERFTESWHVDGDFFTHFLDGQEQGLLCLMLWSDIKPKSGGTFLACDSVPHVARKLYQNPQGLRNVECSPLIDQCRDFYETTGNAGDIYLCHPFMLHATSQKINSEARLLTNPVVSLNQRKNFARENPQEYSPVEVSILNSLGKQSLDFVRTGDGRSFIGRGQVRNWKDDDKVKINWG